MTTLFVKSIKLATEKYLLRCKLDSETLTDGVDPELLKKDRLSDFKNDICDIMNSIEGQE